VYEKGAVSLLQAKAATLPPEFWMWKTTPAPVPPPGPYAQVVWVAATAPPLPTLPPTYEQCFGCDCLFPFADNMIKGGNVANDYTCIGGAAKASVPEMSWSGMPVNSGVGHPILRQDGQSTCPKSLSLAIVVEDLDFPNGIGEKNNHVHTHFWAVNIPGTWDKFNEQLAYQTYKDLPLVLMGKNDAGTIGMDPICPKKGLHRYRFTLWALRDYISSGDEPLDANTPYDQILPKLEQLELAKATMYGNVKAPGGV